MDDDDRVLQAIQPIYTDPTTRQLANGLPPRLLLGWVFAESSGVYNHVERTGEAGYFQIDPDGQRLLHATVDQVIRSKQNSLQYGLRHVQACKAWLQGELERTHVALDPRDDGLSERLTKLVHTVGAPSVGMLLRSVARATQEPLTWDTLTAHWRKNASRLNSGTLRNPERMIANVDRVMVNGARLAPRSMPPSSTQTTPAP